MSKEIYISSTPHETRLAIVEADELTEIYYERENEYTLAGSIYNGKVTRVLPGMQSSFVDIGLERDAFLYITDFMEEAGDSADFDSGESRGRSENRRGGREPRRDDSGSPVLEGERAASGDLAEARPADSRGDREPRGDRDSRGGRRRRGGRDNREVRDNRDDRSRESQPREARLNDAASAPRSDVFATREPEGFVAGAAAFTPAAPIQSGYAEPGSENELGEGAPGADGSRRWRGRRGRRRGRGTREDGITPGEFTTAGPDLSAAESPSSFGSGFETGSGSDISFPRQHEIHAVAETAAEPNRFAPPARVESPSRDEASLAAEAFDPNYRSPAEREAEDSQDSRDSQDFGDSQGSGRRGRDRGSRDRGARDRGGRDDRGPRAPRGFAPSRALYGVESGDDQGNELGNEGPAPEPMILPGEKLSKYTPGGDAASASSSTPSATPATAPEFTLRGAWDGGNVLPGETLRPRNPAPGAREASSRESGPRRDDRRREGGRRDENRRDRQPREDRRPAAAPYETHAAVNPAVPFRNQTEATAPDLDLPTHAGSAPAEPSTFAAEAISRTISRTISKTGLPEAPAILAEPTAPASPRPEPPAHQPTHAGEYEPTEASASFRVDPIPPSEFRQPAPEPAATAEPTGAAPSALETEPPFPSEFSGSFTHSITPPAGEPLTPLRSEAFPEGDTTFAPGAHPLAQTKPQAKLQTEPQTEPQAKLQAEPVPAHDLTAITSEGDMLSETPAPPPSEAVPEPTSPLLQETVVLQAAAEPEPAVASAAHLGETFNASEASARSAEDLTPRQFEQQDFAPGAGSTDDLYAEAGFASEEIEEEEDFHATTLHAASIEEMDYDEEESIEGAGDLGNLLRERTIDQITRAEDPAPESDEDDDYAFEEEDSTGDLAYVAQPDLGNGGSRREPAHTSSFEHDPGEIADEDDGHFVDAFNAAEPVASRETVSRDSDETRSGRRGGRRDNRRGGRDRGSRSPLAASGDRSGGGDRNGGGDRGSRGNGGHREGRRSAQTTNLPAISDLLKPGQELLVQIAKEPIAKKGARITSHIALPGRFLVFMPTVNHTGVSRKIESDGERRRLREILLSEKGEATGGFIVRTAAAGASEEELRSDLRFLLNLWADIKQRSESSKSPALIYHDLNLVERILRDQVTDNFSAIWVDTETEYERVLRFLQRFQPSLIRRVKLYTKETPMYEQFGITEEINKALRSKVWLKSGGSIVINQTEALVAIDINTGKYVGKTARLEDTIVKTNLDAIPEIVRQIRLRDLGGIIIIDFIDMDERKNRNRVMAVLEEELKKDRAPSKVLQFNDFGLVAITRKRVKQSLERTLSTTCNICAGTGMTKSPVTVCNDIYIEMRKMQKHLDRGDVMLRVNPEVVKQLKSPTARWLQEMEEMVGKTILVKSDPALHPEQFDIH